MTSAKETNIFFIFGITNTYKFCTIKQEYVLANSLQTRWESQWRRHYRIQKNIIVECKVTQPNLQGIFIHNCTDKQFLREETNYSQSKHSYDLNNISMNSKHSWRSAWNSPSKYSCVLATRPIEENSKTQHNLISSRSKVTDSGV